MGAVTAVSRLWSTSGAEREGRSMASGFASLFPLSLLLNTWGPAQQQRQRLGIYYKCKELRSQSPTHPSSTPVRSCRFFPFHHARRHIGS